MKRLLMPLLCLLVGTVILAALPTEVEGAVYTDTVRLHVLASSDREEDQKIKLAVRDQILLTYGKLLVFDTKDEAVSSVRELLPRIEETVRSTLSALGADYGVRADLKEEWYDRREYEGFSMPAGRYTSLVISLGEAKGKNWWCVLYPPLCLGMATDAPTDDGVLGEIGGGVIRPDARYEVKFKTLEFFSSLVKNRKK